MSERKALLEERDRHYIRNAELEVKKRQTEEELNRAIGNREQLRKVYEELKRTHAAAAERSAAAFREMSRLQDEVRAAAEQVAKHERETNLLKDELAHARADVEGLQADQLKWAVDREELLKASEAAESRRIELEADLAKTQLALAERTAVAESEAADLRQHLRAMEMEFAADRQRLEVALAEAQDRRRQATESGAVAEKARAELVAQHASQIELAQQSAQEWSTRRQALTEENQRLVQEVGQARQALRSAQEQERQWQGRLQRLEQTQRQEKAAHEDALRTARDLAARPLTPEEGHRINTRLNAIVGFSNVLLDAKANAIAPAERDEYIKLINENSRRLAEELRLVSVVVGDEGAAALPELDGPPVASLGGSPAPPTILVADPDPAVRDRLQPFLTRAGYEVVFVGTGDEAFAQAEALEPLAILIEAELPPGGASAVIGNLKRDPRTADIPVVVTTRNLDEPLGVEIGQVDLLAKPIDRQQLLQVMINHDLQADAKRARKLPATVLVVDDDPQSVRLLKAVLNPLQIEVLAADRGRAGIELAQQRHPELIICDYDAESGWVRRHRGATV